MSDLKANHLVGLYRARLCLFLGLSPSCTISEKKKPREEKSSKLCGA